MRPITRSPNFNFGTPEGAPVFAAAANGTVYASAGDEYQVLAVCADGEADWALRVAHERKLFTEDDRARLLDVVTRTSPGTDTSDAEWPTHFGAISRQYSRVEHKPWEVGHHRAVDGGIGPRPNVRPAPRPGATAGRETTFDSHQRQAPGVESRSNPRTPSTQRHLPALRAEILADDSSPRGSLGCHRSI
jgi:hypothetical protein